MYRIGLFVSGRSRIIIVKNIRLRPDSESEAGKRGQPVLNFKKYNYKTNVSDEYF